VPAPGDAGGVGGRPGRDGAQPVLGVEGQTIGRGPRDVAQPGDTTRPGTLPGDVQSRLTGINLGDPKTRETFIDVLKQMSTGTLKPELLDVNGRKIFEAMKGLEPGKLEQIRQFLTTEVQPAGKPRLDDAVIVNRLKEIIDGGKDVSDKAKMPSTLTELTSTAQRTASERLVEFMRTNKEVLGQGLDSEKSKVALAELGKIVRDLNKELGLDPTRGGITVKEILARNLEGTGTARPGERPLAERTLTGREEALVARLTPAQEALFKTVTERGSRPEAPGALAERRVEAVRLEPGAPVPGHRPGQPEGRLPGEGRPVDARPVGEAPLGAKTEVTGKLEPGVKDLGGKPEPGVPRGMEGLTAAAQQQATRGGDISGQPIDQAGRLPGRGDVTEKTFEEEKKTKKAEDKEREDEQRLTDAQLALLAARKAKEDAEKAEKEKEKAQEKDKKEPERRQKYVVKEKDTLESIAAKMLRDAKLAALILEINKNTIPVRFEKGKQIVDLKPKMVIWLPTTTDIRDFRGRMFGAAATGQFDYGTPASAQGKPLTPEEELAAKFGGAVEDYRVEGAEKGAEPVAGADEAAGGESVDDLRAEAVAAAKRRRGNVEKLLGPVGSQKDESGRIKYTVRLGDTLKSVAIKHPALQDVHLWKLLAETNGMSTDTDAKGTPVAQLKRGSVIVVPSPQEVEEYREKHKMQSTVPKASFEAGGTTIKFDIVTKPCPECARITTQDAEICPGCGHSFAGTAKQAGTGTSPASQPVTASTAPAQAPDAPLAPGTVFDASPGGGPEPAKSAGRPVPPPPIPRKKKTDEQPAASTPTRREPGGLNAGLFSAEPHPSTVQPIEPAKPASEPAQFESAADDLTRQLLGGMGFEPVPTLSQAVPPEAAKRSGLEEREVQGLIQQLSEACRLVKSPGSGGPEAGQKSRLEVRKTDDSWVPIVTYEIYDDVSLRHEFTLDGKRKTIRIDLPPQAVQELAENDLTTNWQNYCSRFLAGKTISD
jgi:LysM repeat protein